MIHSTYVNPLFSQAKLYVLILIKYLIPLTCLKHRGGTLTYVDESERIDSFAHAFLGEKTDIH